MLRNCSQVSTNISNYAFISQSLRGFFWKSSLNCWNGVEKVGEKLSLAYYSYDPSFVRQKKCSPIILYHGLFTSKDMWHSIVKPLSQQTGRTVYLLDMRNHGESPHTKSDKADLKTIANDVNHFMDEFKINKAVLVGHGVGSRAMLQMALSFGDRVEKVAAIHVSPINLPLIGFKITDSMLLTVASLPKNISLSHARLIVNRQLNRYFRDQILLQYILMNLRVDEKGFVKWRFNLPVIIDMLHKGIASRLRFDGKYLGEVLIVCGKHGLTTAQNSDSLKNSFPNAKFNFFQRSHRLITVERPTKLLKLLVEFTGKIE